METRIDILNELRELSPTLSALDKVNVYSVPEGYFESLPDLLLSISKAEELSFSIPVSKANVQGVPAGYFDTLADSILAKIRSDQKNASDELRELSPMLYSIQNENVFEVPKGYFAGLADEVLEKVRPAKVIQMKKHSFSFMKYAVAAVFTGAMAFGVLKFAGNNNGKGIDQATAGVNIDEELKKIPDADIVNYLQSTGTDVKTALVASSVEEGQLPSQEDYLLDDQALDKYLNSINVDDLKN